MSYYEFSDISHYQADIDVGVVMPAAGHRINIQKASDNYNMPDTNGVYYWSPQRHYDSRFVKNYSQTRDCGLVAGAYHFVRYDRPLPVSNRTAIVEANLQYFKESIGMLPVEMQGVKTAILDFEQSKTQLDAAGVTTAVLSEMTRDIVTLFLENYQNVITYSGHWAIDYLDEATQIFLSEKTSLWRPHYIGIDANNNPVDPDFVFTVPAGFKFEYATKADDVVGKVFAWQHTAKARLAGWAKDLDRNQTAMPKDQLYILFGQDGAVDPPPTGETPDYEAVVSDLIELRYSIDDDIETLTEKYNNLV